MPPPGLLGGHRPLDGEQADQQVLGAHPGVSVASGLGVGEGDHPPRVDTEAARAVGYLGGHGPTVARLQGCGDGHPALDSLVRSMPFAEVLGIRAAGTWSIRTRSTPRWPEARRPLHGRRHGPRRRPRSPFADSIRAIVAFLNLPEGATTSTIESKTNSSARSPAAPPCTTRLVSAGRDHHRAVRGAQRRRQAADPHHPDPGGNRAGADPLDGCCRLQALEGTGTPRSRPHALRPGP